MNSIKEYICSYYYPFVPTIPHRDEMLAESIQEFKEEPLSEFLIKMDRQEKEILETPKEILIDNIRSRTLRSNALTIVCGTAGFFLSLIPGSSNREKLIWTAASGTLGYMGARREYNAQECGRKFGEIRIQRLNDKVLVLQSKMDELDEQIKDKGLVKQFQVAQKNFKEISDYYKTVLKYNLNVGPSGNTYYEDHYIEPTYNITESSGYKAVYNYQKKGIDHVYYKETTVKLEKLNRKEYND